MCTCSIMHFHNIASSIAAIAYTTYLFICRDGGGSLYPVIQWNSSASVLQGLKAATRNGEEKVLTTYQTALTVLPCHHAPARGNVQDIFRVSPFSSNSSSSSFPVALAHQQWGIWKRCYHSITEHLMGCIPLCIWECREVVDRWHFFGPFILRFWAKRHLQWRFLQLSEGFSAGAVLRKVGFSGSSVWKTGLSCRRFGQTTLTFFRVKIKLESPA